MYIESLNRDERHFRRITIIMQSEYGETSVVYLPS